MMLSLASTYAEAFLAHGVCVGIGAAMVYVPSLAGLGITFKARRSTAIALASSGGGIGESPSDHLLLSLERTY